MQLTEILDLAPHGPDVYVGVGPQYPWGGLYGGQIVAQALQAAAATVDEELAAHSSGPTSSGGATTPSRSGSRSTGSAMDGRSAPDGSWRARPSEPS